MDLASPAVSGTSVYASGLKACGLLQFLRTNSTLVPYLQYLFIYFPSPLFQIHFVIFRFTSPVFFTHFPFSLLLALFYLYLFSSSSFLFFHFSFLSVSFFFCYFTNSFFFLIFSFLVSWYSTSCICFLPFFHCFPLFSVLTSFAPYILPYRFCLFSLHAPFPLTTPHSVTEIYLMTRA